MMLPTMACMEEYVGDPLRPSPLLSPAPDLLPALAVIGAGEPENTCRIFKAEDNDKTLFCDGQVESAACFQAGRLSRRRPIVRDSYDSEERFRRGRQSGQPETIRLGLGLRQLRNHSGKSAAFQANMPSRRAVSTGRRAACLARPITLSARNRPGPGRRSICSRVYACCG